MNITKTTIIAALALSVAAPLSANAGEGPYEIDGKNVFELNREQQTTSNTTLDTRSGISFGSKGSGYSGEITSDRPYEINGKTVFEYNREKRANRIAEQGIKDANQDKSAVTMTPKKRSWFKRYFRPVQSDQS